MVIQPPEVFSQEQRELLRPKAGDTVLYESQPYLVESTGLRFINLIHPETKTRHLARLDEVMKMVEEPAQPAELDNLGHTQADLDREFGE